MANEALEAASTAARPTAAEVRAALERILCSRCFEHAGRASEFLRFVVGRTLAGDDRLKGYTIAIHVFGRPREFNAQSDPLVRVEALRLRQRLAEYYAQEGAVDCVRLELPRGGYIVKASYVFAEPAPARGGEIAPPQVVTPLRPRARAGWMAATLLLIATAGSIAVQQQAPVAEQAPAVSSGGAHRTKIAVVPFENLSGTVDFERLAAGMTEEVMLRLDELDLFVIDTQARAYGALDNVLGAEHNYILTGSVREHAGGARITMRIIQADTGAQIWGTAYDEPPGVERQPALQAKVARDATVAAAPFGPVFNAEFALARSSAHTLELPDCQTRYRAFRRGTDPALFPDAFACFQSLVARRPTLAHAWAGLAMLFVDEHVFYSGTSDDGSPLANAEKSVRTAMELDDTNILANVALARVQYFSGDPDFLLTAERALSIEPKNPDVAGALGVLLTSYGDSTHGLELIARAHQLAPRPLGAWNLGYAYAHLPDGKPCEALAATQQMEAPMWFVTHVVGASAAALCGDAAALADARRRLLALSPQFESEGLALISAWRFNPALHDALLRGLRQAGFELREG